MKRVENSFVICAALVGAGCNQIHGLDQTRALGACDATELAFGRAPRTVIPTGRDAHFYGIDEARRTAIVYGASGTPTGVLEGAVDADLSELAISIVDGRPRITPEGDQLLVRTATAAYSFYTRDPNGTWQRGDDVPFAFADRDELGTPSRRAGGERRVIGSDGTTVVEYLATDTAWTLADSYSRAELGLSSTTRIIGPNLTPDGLHLVFAGSNEILYHAYRPDLGVRFDPAKPIDVGALTPGHPYLTPDCERLYFSDVTHLGDRGVYYAER